MRTRATRAFAAGGKDRTRGFLAGRPGGKIPLFTGFRPHRYRRTSDILGKMDPEWGVRQWFRGRGAAA